MKFIPILPKLFIKLFKGCPITVWAWSRKGVWTHTQKEEEGEYVSHNYLAFGKYTSPNEDDPSMLFVYIWKLQIAIGWARVS